MLLPKNVGIFGEAEEKHNKMIKRMVAEGALLKFIESLENYPDPDDPREQILMDEMLKIVIERFNEIGGDDDEIFDAD